MTTCEPLSNGGEASPDQQLTLWSEDSLANRCPPQAGVKRRRTSGGSGQQPTWSFATYDPDGSCWRTCRVSLDGEWETYSATWPRAGMTRNGTAYPRPPSAPLTDATVSSWLPTPTASPGGYNQSPSPGAAVRPSLSTMARTGLWPTPTARVGDPRRGTPSPRLARLRYRSGRRNLDDAMTLWPTPRASDGERGGRGDLLAMVRTGQSSRRRDWPTPTARDAGRGKGWEGPGRPLSEAVGGPLNPTWVEWLLGLPMGWTDLELSVTP